MFILVKIRRMEYESSDYLFIEHSSISMQIYEYCLKPTIEQSLEFIWKPLAINILFLVLVRLFTKTSPSRFNVFSILLGVIFVQRDSKNELIYLASCVYVSYFLIIYFKRHNIVEQLIGTSFIILLILSEYFYWNYSEWLKMRSSVMIAMMKIISLTFDIKKTDDFPTFLEYSGYIWCPANSLLGPWIPFKEYERIRYNNNKINLAWLFSILWYLSVGIIFVCVSNCIYGSIYTEDLNSFIGSYKEAGSFRMSHYFISYFASALMISAGFSKNNNWSYTITSPFSIEFPRSLVNVVIYWNISTHNFLRKYIFPVFLPHGKFIAIFMTYVISSMLHGLSIEVSVVLLSLGIFSYVQNKFQDSIAFITNLCVKVRPCKDCSHKHNKWLTNIINFIFSMMTVLYLAYVGCLMENFDSTRHSIDKLLAIYDKWHNLYFFAHFMAVLCLIFSLSFRKCLNL